jgi:hypothetical protein
MNVETTIRESAETFVRAKFLKCQLVNQKKQISNHLLTADHGGQKNHNGKTIAVLFYHVFY